MELLILCMAGFYLFAVTWVFYLAIMNIKRNQDKLTIYAKILAYPTVVIGYLFDITLNLTVGCVLFLELPRELVLSERLSRHKTNSSGWRLRRASWICANLLDPFDPSGNHCKM